MREIRSTGPESPHILIAEDEPHIVRLLETVLSEESLRVSVARTGTEALDRIRSDRSISVVLLDVLMPEMSGLEVLRSAREGEEARSLPVVVLSGKGETALRTRAMALGATAFFTKPFSPRKLRSRILEICGTPESRES